MRGVGRVIRERRRELGVTQEQLERASGVSQTHISQIERGHTSRPEMGTLAAIADALSMPARDLLVAAGWIVVEQDAGECVAVAVQGTLPGDGGDGGQLMTIHALPAMLAGATAPFALVVATDDLRPWCIERGAYLIVDGDPARLPADGDLVVVRPAGGGATLARWVVTPSGVRLVDASGVTLGVGSEARLSLVGVYVYHLPPLPLATR